MNLEESFPPIYVIGAYSAKRGITIYTFVNTQPPDHVPYVTIAEWMENNRLIGFVKLTDAYKVLP